MSVLVLTDETSFAAHWCEVFANHGLSSESAELRPFGASPTAKGAVLFVSGRELMTVPSDQLDAILGSPSVKAKYKVILLSREHLAHAPAWMAVFDQWFWEDEPEEIMCRRVQWILRSEKARVARTSHTSRLVNHDVNNPLTAIRILSEMLHGDISDPTLRTDLDDIMEAADVATATIEAYSSLLKARDGTKPTFGLPTDVAGVVQDIIKRPALRNCTDYLGASGVCTVPVDNAVLRSVITDVLMNARKMTDGRSRIEVGMAVVGASVQLTCRSVAIGLPADVREHLLMDNGAGLLRERRLPVLSVGLHGAWRTLSLLGGSLTLSDAQDGGLEVNCIFPTQAGG